MPTNTGAVANLIAPNLRKVYIDTGKEYPLEYPLVFNVSDMEWNPMTDRQVSGLDTAVSKPEGTQFTFDEFLDGGSKTYTAAAFGLAVEITWEAWRDELYGVMKEMVAGLARAIRNRQEISAWSHFNNAFATADGFDSTVLCSVSHTDLEGTNHANRPATHIAFSQTALQNATIRFEDMTDERGIPRLMAPTNIIIASANKYVAREILGSAGKAYTAQNEINALVEDDLSYMISHYLTTSTYWFLNAKKGEHDMNFLWRDQPIFDMFDDPSTKNAVATVYMRYASGWGTYRGIDGSTG